MLYVSAEVNRGRGIFDEQTEYMGSGCQLVGGPHGLVLQEVVSVRHTALLLRRCERSVCLVGGVQPGGGDA